MSYVRAWFFAGSVGTLVAAATRSGSAVAQVVQDPGARGGPPGSGGPLPNLIPGGGSQPSQPGFFQAAKFSTIVPKRCSLFSILQQEIGRPPLAGTCLGDVTVGGVRVDSIGNEEASRCRSRSACKLLEDLVAI
jgi:hypothetical protein